MSTNIIESACNLLNLCASQETWMVGCRDAPGFSAPVRELAELVAVGCRAMPVDGEEWRECYAEAEARLRDLLW